MVLVLNSDIMPFMLGKYVFNINRESSQMFSFKYWADSSDQHITVDREILWTARLAKIETI